jgi:hypothetical protein
MDLRQSIVINLKNKTAERREEKRSEESIQHSNPQQPTEQQRTYHIPVGVGDSLKITHGRHSSQTMMENTREGFTTTLLCDFLDMLMSTGVQHITFLQT